MIKKLVTINHCNILVKYELLSLDNLIKHSNVSLIHKIIYSATAPPLKKLFLYCYLYNCITLFIIMCNFNFNFKFVIPAQGLQVEISKCCYNLAQDIFSCFNKFNVYCALSLF